MKPLLQYIVAGAAAFALSYHAAALATDVSDRPLNAAVLVKPNLIFGLDDSGSMDFEMLFNTSGGQLWWEYFGQKGWSSDGTLQYSPSGATGYYGSSQYWTEMSYVFPNGVSQSNGQRLYSDASDMGAPPPTKQFAFVRSNAYNPLYYDTTKTYSPWGQAYMDGAVRTFSNATPTAAKSHPYIGLATMDLTANQCNGSSGYVFVVHNGMRIDKGMKTGNNCGTTESADRTVSPGGGNAYTTMQIQYYPATFWVPETCTVSTNDLTCATAPDGATLKRYEIKSGNTFPSGRTYAAELQNFANWFQYYRKRKLMLAASMSKVFSSLTGMRIGIVPFNDRSNVTMFDVDSTDNTANDRAALAPFYTSNNAAGTPTRETLQYIGQQYQRTGTGAPVQYACQRNNAFIVTDGYANATSASPGTYTKSTYGAGAPYATTQDGTLADLALGYYTINARSDLATGRVPTGDVDTNPNLHVNTYGMTLGSTGTIWQDATTATPATSTTAYAWPDPFITYSPKAIDDLWHATINGRGKMYLATDPTNTASALQAGLDDILSKVSTQAGIAVSSVNLGSGDGRAYLPLYNPKGWAGDLTARTLSSSTGAIGTTDLWSASSLLAARTTARVIGTNTGSGGVAFGTASAITALVNPSQAYGTDAAVIGYLRGARTGEGSTFRQRYSLMGAVINAKPVIDPKADTANNVGVVYQPSGEGMVHAFNSSTGQELWAYVPSFVLSSLGPTTQIGYRFGTLLDGSPTLATVGSTKVLIGGRGAAGAGWYALNVTSPTSVTESNFSGVSLWEFPNSSTTAAVKNQLGLSVGTPKVVRIQGTSNYVALLTSGYNAPAADGIGRLFVLNATTGAVSATLAANSGTSGVDPGLAQVTPYYETDGTVRYVYGGDELGNLWRFDLTTNAVTRIATLKDGSGSSAKAQPITSAPVLSLDSAGRKVIYVGTGRMLGLTDLSTSPSTQTIYAISDGATITDVRGGTLVAQTYSTSSNRSSTNAVDWTAKRGWYMDVPSGELINTTPTVVWGALVFATNKSAISDCSASSKLYTVDMTNGWPIGAAPATSTTAAVAGNAVAATISDTQMVTAIIATRTTGQGVTPGSVGTIQIIGRTYGTDPVRSQPPLEVPQVKRQNSWLELRRR